MFITKDNDKASIVELRLVDHKDGVQLMAVNPSGLRIKLLDFTPEGVHAYATAGVPWLIAEGLKFDDAGRLIVGR